MKLTPRQKFSRALNQVMRDDPFLATILMKLKHIESDDCPSLMRTDGKMLEFNPKMLDERTQQDIEFILKHEAFHVANGHNIRQRVLYDALKQSAQFGQKLRDLGLDQQDLHMMHNVACDLAVNELLRMNREYVPEDALIVGANGYAGFQRNKSSEHYFMKLFDQEEEEQSKKKQKVIVTGKRYSFSCI